jgi:endonuclease/exonuclease/phosphatase (EEP) superfamily protein YafD
LDNSMRIATYNVNGINGRLANLLGWLEEATPDIVCLQELKAPMTNFRPRSATPATARSGTGRKAGTALPLSRGAASRWRPAAAYPAIPTIRTAAMSKRRSAAMLSALSIAERQSRAGREVRFQAALV